MNLPGEHTLRGTAVTTRVGVALGVAVAICFVTGLISHFIQHPQPWFFWPTTPAWTYRVTQGLHVMSGIAAIPLLVVKLWSVYPKLFERPIIGGLSRQLERASILVLMASMLFQFTTGLMNVAKWYAFKFFFTTNHYAMAYVAAGAVLVSFVGSLLHGRTGIDVLLAGSRAREAARKVKGGVASGVSNVLPFRRRRQKGKEDGEGEKEHSHHEEQQQHHHHH